MTSLPDDLRALREAENAAGYCRCSGDYREPAAKADADLYESRILSTVSALTAERDLAVRERDALKAHHAKSYQRIRDARQEVIDAVYDAVNIEAIGCGWCQRVIGHTPDCEGVKRGAMVEESANV